MRCGCVFFVLDSNYGIYFIFYVYIEFCIHGILLMINQGDKNIDALNNIMESRAPQTEKGHQPKRGDPPPCHEGGAKSSMTLRGGIVKSAIKISEIM